VSLEKGGSGFEQALNVQEDTLSPQGEIFLFNSSRHRPPTPSKYLALLAWDTPDRTYGSTQPKCEVSIAQSPCLFPEYQNNQKESSTIQQKYSTYNATSGQFRQNRPHRQKRQLFRHEVHKHMRHLMTINELANEILAIVVEVVGQPWGVDVLECGLDASGCDEGGGVVDSNAKREGEGREEGDVC
jgi:hypothetical protein